MNLPDSAIRVTIDGGQEDNTQSFQGGLMKRFSGPRRTVSNLPESIHQQLNMYALAAGAAGVGMLAVAPSSEAKIVYTPTHTNIAPNHTIALDLNHDGIKDFSFQNPYSFDGNSGGGTLNLVPARAANQAWVAAGYAAAVVGGVRVGPNRPFAPNAKPMARVFVTPSSTPNTRGYGPWAAATKRYLAVKFLIQGRVHFGWARLNVKAQAGGVVATLTGYAYETIPNKPIITGHTKGPDDKSGVEPVNPTALTAPTPDKPQPATLGMLALGAQGAPPWRRKEAQEVSGQ
jgi:hypothetical protein